MSPQVEALREVVFEAIRIIQLLDDRTLDTGDGETVDLLQVIERWDGVLDSVDDMERQDEVDLAMSAPRLRREAARYRAWRDAYARNNGNNDALSKLLTSLVRAWSPDEVDAALDAFLAKGAA